MARTRILVADDFADWCLKIREQVNHSSDIVGEACNGLEAVQKAAELQPDVVILDLNMPRMNGVEAARCIRQRSRSTAVIFLTKTADADIQGQALTIGHACVLKRNAYTELLAAIKAAQAAAASERESDFSSRT